MNATKRAIARITRHPKESVGILLLFLLVLASTAMCAYIADAFQTAADSLREKTGASFTVYGNPKECESQGNGEGVLELAPILSRDVEMMSEIEGVTASNSRQSCTLSIDGIALPSGMPLGIVSTDTSTALDRRFREGALKLSEGRHIEAGEDEVALVSEELAEENGLEIGSALRITASAPAVRIVGIYVQGESEGYNPDEVIVDEQSYLMASGEERSAFARYADFYVEDPSKVQSLMNEAKALTSAQGSDYLFRANETVYDSAMKQLSNIESMVLVLAYATSVVGVALTILATLLRLRGRIRELGIFRLLGFSKRQIAEHFALELAFLFLAAVALSLPIIGLGAWTTEGAFYSAFGISLTPINAINVLFAYMLEAIAIVAGLLASLYPKMRLSPFKLLTKTK